MVGIRSIAVQKIRLQQLKKDEEKAVKERDNVKAQSLKKDIERLEKNIAIKQKKADILKKSHGRKRSKSVTRTRKTKPEKKQTEDDLHLGLISHEFRKKGQYAQNHKERGDTVYYDLEPIQFGTYRNLPSKMRELKGLKLSAIDRKNPNIIYRNILKVAKSKSIITNDTIDLFNRFIDTYSKDRKTSKNVKDFLINLKPVFTRRRQNELTKEQYIGGDDRILDKKHSAIRGYFSEYSIGNINSIKPYDFINKSKQVLTNTIKRVMTQHGNQKVILASSNLFGREEMGIFRDFRILPTMWINTKPLTITNINDIEFKVNEMVNRLITRIEEWQGKGSGFLLYAIKKLTLNFSRFNPLHASGHIKVIDFINKKSGLINPDNTDDKCHMWASLIIACHDKVKHHRERTNSYKKYQQMLNYDGVVFPVKPTSDIMGQLEEQNPSYRWVIYGFNEHTYLQGNHDMAISKLWVSPRKQTEYKTINLLFYERENECHYLAQTVNIATISKTYKSSRHNYYSCDRCDKQFNLLGPYQMHIKQDDCSMNEQIIRMPEMLNKYQKTAYLKAKKEEGFNEIEWINDRRQDMKRFKNPKAMSFNEIVYYADIESTLRKPIENGKVKNTHHFSSVFSLCVNKNENTFSPSRIYRSTELKDWLLYLKQDVITKYNKLQKKKQIALMNTMSDEQKNEYNALTHCPRCKMEFGIGCMKLRHHDHKTGDYICGLCTKCNFADSLRWVSIPVFFHNGRSYDFHYIIKALQEMGIDNMKVIAENFEKYKTIEWQLFTGLKIVFRDSYLFLTSSLEKLVDNAKNGHTNTRKEHLLRFKYTYNVLRQRYPSI